MLKSGIRLATHCDEKNTTTRPIMQRGGKTNSHPVSGERERESVQLATNDNWGNTLIDLVLERGIWPTINEIKSKNIC